MLTFSHDIPGVKTEKIENYFTVKVTMKADFGDKLKSI